MNKELILKYKQEFDHWLLTNNCLLKTKVEGNWIKVTDSTWNLAEDNLIIINDEYVKFRKALAEGKTIQYYLDDYNEWVDCVNQTSPSREFIVPPSKYRIKPEEPKFKVGDKVTVTYNSDSWEDVITSIDDNLYYFESGVRLSIKRQNEQIKPIKFKVGDWVRCSDLGKNEIIKITGEYYPLDDAYQCSNGIRNSKYLEPWQPKQGEWCWFNNDKKDTPILRQLQKIENYEFKYRTYPTNKDATDVVSVNYRNCEPFIGELPTSLKGN